MRIKKEKKKTNKATSTRKLNDKTENEAGKFVDEIGDEETFIWITDEETNVQCFFFLLGNKALFSEQTPWADKKRG